MGTRAEALAERCSRANAGFVAFVAWIPADEWDTVIGNEDPRLAGVLAQHVAWAFLVEQRHFEAMAAGRPLDAMARGELDALNARMAEAWAGVTPPQVLAALRENGEAVAHWVGGLSDEQLARRGVPQRPTRPDRRRVDRGGAHRPHPHAHE